jgi:D-3-phosphoglycerate dehydrogenase
VSAGWTRRRQWQIEDHNLAGVIFFAEDDLRLTQSLAIVAQVPGFDIDKDKARVDLDGIQKRRPDCKKLGDGNVERNGDKPRCCHPIAAGQVRRHNRPAVDVHTRPVGHIRRGYVALDNTAASIMDGDCSRFGNKGAQQGKKKYQSHDPSMAPYVSHSVNKGSQFMPKLVYLDAFPAENALDILGPEGWIDLVRVGSDEPLEQTFETLRTAHAWQCVPARDEVPEPLRIHREFLAKVPNLLVVSSGGAGYDTFDVDACTEAGVLVVNQSGGNAEAVAEHALGMILTLMKRIPEADRALRRGWNGPRLDFRGRDLLGKTVGIVGLGNIGRRLAWLCRHAFSCKVLAYDPYIDADEFARRDAIQVSLEDLLAQSDVVSVHTPLTAETRGMFGGDLYQRMKANALFIQTARGSIHEEPSLVKALASGHLGGAGLDVWEEEPPKSDHALLQFDNVICSPHTAGVSKDSRERMARYAATQLIALLKGEDPLRPVNPEVLPRYHERFRALLG